MKVKILIMIITCMNLISCADINRSDYHEKNSVNIANQPFSSEIHNRSQQKNLNHMGKENHVSYDRVNYGDSLREKVIDNIQ